MKCASAIYAGTFDPITNGHIDIIERASSVFDRLILVVSINPTKLSFLSIDDRVLFSKKATSHLKNVQVIESRDLVARVAEKYDVRILVRGIRSLSELEYEKQLSHVNRRLSPKLDTIFFIASEGKSLVSSSLVKELAKHDGDVRMFLPPSIFSEFMNKFRFEA